MTSNEIKFQVLVNYNNENLLLVGTTSTFADFVSQLKKKKTFPGEVKIEFWSVDWDEYVILDSLEPLAGQKVKLRVTDIQKPPEPVPEPVVNRSSSVKKAPISLSDLEALSSNNKTNGTSNKREESLLDFLSSLQPEDSESIQSEKSKPLSKSSKRTKKGSDEKSRGSSKKKDKKDEKQQSKGFIKILAPTSKKLTKRGSSEEDLPSQVPVLNLKRELSKPSSPSFPSPLASPLASPINNIYHETSEDKANVALSRGLSVLSFDFDSTRSRSSFDPISSNTLFKMNGPAQNDSNQALSASSQSIPDNTSILKRRKLQPKQRKKPPPADQTTKVRFIEEKLFCNSIGDWTFDNHMDDPASIEIEDSGCRYLSDLMQGSRNAIILSLKHHGITAMGINQLQRPLLSTPTLTCVHLDGNPIGDAGVHILSKILQVNSSITELSLTNCGITDQATTGLSTSLKTNASVRSLLLDKNKLTNAGLKKLMIALNYNTSLASVSLYSNDIDPLLLSHFQKVLRSPISQRPKVQTQFLNDEIFVLWEKLFIHENFERFTKSFWNRWILYSNHVIPLYKLFDSDLRNQWILRMIRIAFGEHLETSATIDIQCCALSFPVWFPNGSQTSFIRAIIEGLYEGLGAQTISELIIIQLERVFMNMLQLISQEISNGIVPILSGFLYDEKSDEWTSHKLKFSSLELQILNEIDEPSIPRILLKDAFVTTPTDDHDVVFPKDCPVDFQSCLSHGPDGSHLFVGFPSQYELDEFKDLVEQSDIAFQIQQTLNVN